jgi:L-alanine-DL-glutamate epimerase-like enolase superfamily enzyme
LDHQLEKYDIHVMRLPYARSIKWSGHMESGADIILLVLHTTSGFIGVSETPVRLKWNSASVRSFLATLEDVVLPVISGVDLSSPKDVNSRLSSVREHPLAKSLVDVACCDLRAAIARTPLWKALGATSASVPVSFTVTRAEPRVMATEAAMAVEKYGMRAFKIKTGQGAEIDRAVLRDVRSAVGRDAMLFADSNGGHAPEEVPLMSRILADEGVLYFEDPCALLPTRSFAKVASSCALPILVDNGCRSLRDARLFIDAGAKALSAKVMKTGITESLAIAKEAETVDVKVAVGVSACSAFGAIAALSVSNALPASTRGIPCEETFFITAGGFLKEPLSIEGGCVELPKTPTTYELIDWKKVQSLKLSNSSKL